MRSIIPERFQKIPEKKPEWPLTTEEQREVEAVEKETLKLRNNFDKKMRGILQSFATGKRAFPDFHKILQYNFPSLERKNETAKHSSDRAYMLLSSIIATLKDNTTIESFGSALTLMTFGVLKRKEKTQSFEQERLSFWNRQVGRSIPRMKDGMLINEPRVSKDKIITDHGAYCEQVSTKQEFSPTALIAACLEEMVLDRRHPIPEFKNGETHVALPDRKDQKYWVTIVRGREAQKISVTMTELRAFRENPDLSTIGTSINQQLAEGKWIDYETYAEINAKNRHDMAYLPEKKLTTKQHDKLITNPEAIDVADCRIVIGDQERVIGDVQEDRFHFTGVGTPLSIDLTRIAPTDEQSSERCSGKTTIKFNHSEIDGARALYETTNIVSRAIQLTREQPAAPGIAAGEFNSRSTYPENTNTKVATVEIDRGFYEQSVNQFFDFYKTKYGVKFSWSSLEAIATMMTLGTETIHFLEQVPSNKSLGVSLQTINQVCQEEFSNFDPDHYDREHPVKINKNVMLEFLAAQNLAAISSADARAGYGIPNIFAVLTPLSIRSLIVTLTKVTKRDVIDALSDSYMVSCLSSKDGYRPISVVRTADRTLEPIDTSAVTIEGFSTAFSDIYLNNKAVVGFIDQEKRKLVGTLRDSSPDHRHVIAFNENFAANLHKLIGVLVAFAEQDKTATEKPVTVAPPTTGRFLDRFRRR